MSKNMQDNKTQGDFAFPKEWTVFGPVGKDDPEPDFGAMKDIPKELTIAGNRLVGQNGMFEDNRLDLGALLGGKGDYKTAYAVATVEADKDTEIELGAGADWWMKWWVNGEVVCDTTASEGNFVWPPHPLNRRFTARLQAGSNLVAVKVVSGVGGFVLAAADASSLNPCSGPGLARQADFERLAASKDLRDRLELSAIGLMDILVPENDLMPTGGYEAAHDLGRWWDAALRLEEAIGFVIPAELEAASLRNLQRLTDNPDRLLTNRPDVPWLKDKSRINHHNFRETLLAFGGLVRRRRNLWARDAGLQLAQTMGRVLQADGSFDSTELGLWATLPEPVAPDPATPGVWRDTTGSSGRALEALVWFYEETGCDEVADVASRIAACHLANSTNPDGSVRREIVDPDNNGHNHSYHGTLRGLLLFGLLTGQREYVDTVEATYRNAVRHRLVKESGWAPHDLGETNFPNAHGDPVNEPSSTGDSAQLALWLALRAGCDDLLDDVERLVRARLLPSQCTEGFSILSASGLRPYIGAWAVFGQCHAGKGCTPDVHAAVIHTLCDVYQNILTHTASGVRVNLHFNAENEWIRTTVTRDVHEARLSVRVKQPENVWIRIPGWAPEASLRLCVDGRTLIPRRLGVFAWVPASALKAGSEIVLVYDLPERQTQETMPSGRTYTFAWRGDEIVGISPQEYSPSFYPERQQRGKQQ